MPLKALALRIREDENVLMVCLYFLCLRYVTILTLVRVRVEQKGLYTVIITNEDDTKHVTFDLEVRGMRRRDLSY